MDHTSYNVNNYGNFESHGAPILTNPNIQATTVNINSKGLDKFESLRHLRQTDPRADKLRIESQNGRPLTGSYEWVFRDNAFERLAASPSGLLWIRGNPGKGKTTMMIGIINQLLWADSANPRTPTCSYFFCENGSKFHNNAVSVLRGLLYMLLDQRQDLMGYLERAYESAGPRLFEDGETVLFYTLQTIFSKILSDDKVGPVYFMLDALDECQGNLQPLISLILQSIHNQRVKWIITSRKTHEIVNNLRSVKLVIDLEDNHSRVDHAVRSFIDEKIQEYDESLRDEVAHYLKQKSEGTFLWVHLVCKRLAQVPSWLVLDELESFPKGLDAFYERMFEQITRDGKELVGICYQILGIVILAYRPMALREIVNILELPPKLENFLHRKRSSKNFLIGIVGDMILQWILVEEITPMQKAQIQDIEYASCFWARHLTEGFDDSSGGLGKEDTSFAASRYQEISTEFFDNRLFNWVEAMSILSKVPEAFQQLTFINLIGDAKGIIRFLQQCRVVVEKAPLQIYNSVIVFYPPTERTFRSHRKYYPNWLQIQPEIEDGHSQVIEARSFDIRSFASHSNLLASGDVGDYTIRVWDLTTGSCQYVFHRSPEDGICKHGRDSCCQEPIFTVKFSLDGSKIYAVSDTRFDTWDLGSSRMERSASAKRVRGRLVHQMRQINPSGQVSIANFRLWQLKHSDTDLGVTVPNITYCMNDLDDLIVENITYVSEDDYLLICRSADQENTIIIWDSSAKALRALQHELPSGFCHPLKAVELKSVLGAVYLGLYDKSELVYIWEIIRDHTELAVVDLHALSRAWGRGLFIIHPEYDILFSPEVRGLIRGGIVARNASSRDDVHRFRGHLGPITAFHIPNRRLLVSASKDGTIRLWGLQRVANNILEPPRADQRNQPEWIVGGMLLSPCGEFLAVREYPVPYTPDVEIWNLRELCRMFKVRLSQGELDRIGFVSQDGYTSFLVTSSDNAGLDCWDLRTGARGVVEDAEGAVSSAPTMQLWIDNNWGLIFRVAQVELSPGVVKDGIYMHTVKVTERGISLKRFYSFVSPISGEKIEDVALSLDGRRVGVTYRYGDATIVVDRELGKTSRFTTTDFVPGFNKKVAFSQDGRLLARLRTDTTSLNGAYHVSIWEIGEGKAMEGGGNSKGLIGQAPISRRIGDDFSLCFLKFETDYIRTSWDLFPANSKKIVPGLHGLPDVFSFSGDFEWLLYNYKRILWIPHDIRPQGNECWRILDNLVVFASRSGQIYSIRIDVAKLKEELGRPLQVAEGS
ncbi:hypothetical protein ABW19_dt0203503 [Dactylella cylindrospora]|nr:hypothetical protein ABW19_dt0203503 [Dactylella cylindrospora]